MRLIFHIPPHLLIFLGQLYRRNPLQFAARTAGLWLAISASSLALIVLISSLGQALLRLKIRMAETDGTSPLPLFNRRKAIRRRSFRLRLTRRPLTVEEGSALERVNFEIDVLIQTHHLGRFIGAPPGPRPPEFQAVETLLKHRAEFLERHPPLPSFRYLLQRRLLLALSRVRTRA